MDLLTMLNHVLPEDCILYKQNPELWEVYVDERAFDKGMELTSQRLGESFTDFIKRSIRKLIEELEKDDPNPLVSINCEIHGGLD